MSGPNLSEYFRNDAPSMFDEIVVPSPTVATAAASPVTGKYSFAWSNEFLILKYETILNNVQ